MTSIIPSRRAAAANGQTPKEILGPVAWQPSRFEKLSLQETYSELGATDAAVDAALARLAAVWGDARVLDTDLERATSNSKQKLAVAGQEVVDARGRSRFERRVAADGRIRFTAWSDFRQTACNVRIYAHLMPLDAPAPLSFSQTSIPWEAPAEDGTRAATLVGTRDIGVQFTYAFLIPPHVYDQPHTHSADAHLIVASGELLLGYGEIFDRSGLVRYPAGSFLFVPAGVSHYDGAEIETVLIGTATGPWSTDYVQPTVRA